MGRQPRKNQDAKTSEDGRRMKIVAGPRGFIAVLSGFEVGVLRQDADSSRTDLAAVACVASNT